MNEQRKVVGKRIGTEGFTIVELLIVIVVIAILAAITVAAYNGIQTRASDSVVQSDLRTSAQQIASFYIDNGNYPTGTNIVNGNPRLSFAKSSYLVTNNAVLYCVSTDGSKMALIGKSKSGTVYYVTESALNARPYGFSFPNGVAVDCPNAGVTAYSGSWIHAQGSGWVSWVNG